MEITRWGLSGGLKEIKKNLEDNEGGAAEIRMGRFQYTTEKRCNSSHFTRFQALTVFVYQLYKHASEKREGIHITCRQEA
jgi:hypothetical protein